MSKRAFITGIAGQDGSYLAEYLLDKGYEVFGVDKVIPGELPGVAAALEKCTVKEVDLIDLSSYEDFLQEANPDEVYNFAAVSDLGLARREPEMTVDLNYGAVKTLVDAALKVNPDVRIFQALSSRILVQETDMVDESAPLAEPENAYDVGKRRALEEVVLPYREKGVFISSGFLFNHESPRRSARFVTGKFARAAAQIAAGIEKDIEIGNVESLRDWSYAKDFAIGAWYTLQAEKPDEYVFASGTLHTVREFVTAAFAQAGIEITWEGEGKEVIGKNEQGEVIIRVNPDFYNEEKPPKPGDASKLKLLGWKPSKTFEEMVHEMVEVEQEQL